MLRREILKTLWMALLLPSVLLKKRRMEPLEPQPKPGTEELVCHYYDGDFFGESDFISDVGQGYETMFWDVPGWVKDWELLDGIWYWV